MIRNAEAKDIPDLIDLGQLAIKESGHPARMDRKKTRQMLFHSILLHKKNGPVRVWVSEVDKKVVGVLIGQIDALYFSKDKYASDLVFYVLPDYRGHGIPLIKRFVSWAHSDPKVVDITLQQSSGIDIQRTERLYLKLGFKRVGGCFVNYRGKYEQSGKEGS